MTDQMIKNDTHMPKMVLKTLEDDYLKKGEQIIDVIHETFIPAIDFRWVILTNERIIIAIRKLLTTTFRVIDLSEMEYTFTKGAILFDTLEFYKITERYRANLYSFDRKYTQNFVDNIKTAQEALEKEMLFEDSEIAKEPVQTLKDLAELKDRGIVSEREFNKAKEDLLKKFRQEKEQ